MHKKLIMACMAIAAFAAFVVAPAASASPVLTHNGTPVPVGTQVIATNVGETRFTGTGGVEAKCDHVKLTGPVTVNSGSTIKGEITTKDFNGTGTSTDCTSNLFNAPVGVSVGKLCLTVHPVPADTVVTTGCGGPVTFTLNFTNVATCKYSRASINANFTTGSPKVTVNSAEETNLSEGGFACPGGGFLDMTFELWTDVGGAESGVPLVVS